MIGDPRSARKRTSDVLCLINDLKDYLECIILSGVRTVERLFLKELFVRHKLASACSSDRKSYTIIFLTPSVLQFPRKSGARKFPHSLYVQPCPCGPSIGTVLYCQMPTKYFSKNNNSYSVQQFFNPQKNSLCVDRSSVNRSDLAEILLQFRALKRYIILPVVIGSNKFFVSSFIAV